MKARNHNGVPAWIVVYVGMIAAVVLAERDEVPGPSELSLVSPVILGQAQSTLELDAIARRSDL